MNMAAYCRVSTQREEQLDSLAHQKEFFQAYAQRMGHTLVGLYADEGISGTSLKRREEFQRLLADGAKGKFQLLVVKDVSRFARNTVDALQSIRTLKALGINTLFLTANMDTMGDSEFVLTLFSAMAQEESGNLSKRVKWGKKINAGKGRVPQGLFGYQRLDNFTLAIHPEEARVVRKIFTLYTRQDLGCRSIALTLNRDGDRTKLGGQWNPRGVRRVLGNPIYGGTLVNHKYEVADYLTGKQVPVPQAEQMLHDRPQWAIVPPEMFRRAQEIMAARRVRYDSGGPFRESRYSGRHLFSTLIKCAHCGRSFTRKQYTYRNTRIYWRCVTNDQYTAQHCDNRVTLDEPELREQLGAYLQSRISHGEAFAGKVRQALEKAAPRDPEAKRQALEAARRRLRGKLDRYRELYAEGLLTLEALRDKQSALEAALAEGEAALQSLPPPEEDSRKVDQAIREFLSLETMTNGDLRRLIDHIQADREGRVTVVFRNLTP